MPPSPQSGRKGYSSGTQSHSGMLPENQQRFIAVVAFVVVLVVAGFGTYYAATVPPHSPSSLITAGTEFHFRPGTDFQFSMDFDVTWTTGRLMGGLYADNGGSLIVIPASASSGSFPQMPIFCRIPWNFTVDASLTAGQYVLWFYGPAWHNLTVTRTVQVVYPGGPASSGWYQEHSGPWTECQ